MMKLRKTIITAVMAIVLIALFAVSAFAADFHMLDDAGVLDTNDSIALESKATGIEKEYQCGIYMVTVSDMAHLGYDDIERLSEDVYDRLGLGYGDEHTGMLLIVSINDREYDLDSYGRYANSVFSDYAKDLLEDVFVDDFSNGDWYAGFDDYLDLCADILRDGGVDESALETRKNVISVVVAVVIGIIAAAAYCGVLKKQMNTAVKATEADEYVESNGVDILANEDIFTHTTVVRQHINNDSRGGGSAGHSHHSGSF